MPGATLHIERGVEVHIWPGVEILVLGDIIADGTYWEPIRFKPINVTEFNQIRNKIGTRYKRSVVHPEEKKFEKQRYKRVINRARADTVFQKFPALYRDDPYYQKFSASLTNNGSVKGRSGFLQIYNSTTGEYIASCDRQFTMRNAQVVEVVNFMKYVCRWSAEN